MTTDQSREAFEALRAALSKCSKMTVHDIDWVPLHEVLILLENPSFGWQAARQAGREAVLEEMRRLWSDLCLVTSDCPYCESEWPEHALDDCPYKAFGLALKAPATKETK